MAILEMIRMKEARIGVIGLGSVGLPLVVEFCRAGFPVMGFDIDEAKTELLNQGKSYIKHIDSSALAAAVEDGFRATTDFSLLREMDCILICVPTPLNENREPDMANVFNSGKSIAASLSRGQLVVLESATYPETNEELRAILEKSGLKAGNDFYLAFSPKWEASRNNGHFNVWNIPKVVGGCTPKCLAAATALYNCIVGRTVPVSSPRVAEATCPR